MAMATGVEQATVHQPEGLLHQPVLPTAALLHLRARLTADPLHLPVSPDQIFLPKWVPGVKVVPGEMETAGIVEEATGAVAATSAEVAGAGAAAAVLVVAAEAVAAAGDDNLSLLRNTNLFIQRNIRSTHIPHADIFTISLFKQAHIVPRINDGVDRVNQFKITNFHYLVPVAGYEHVVGFE